MNKPLSDIEIAEILAWPAPRSELGKLAHDRMKRAIAEIQARRAADRCEMMPPPHDHAVDEPCGAGCPANGPQPAPCDGDHPPPRCWHHQCYLREDAPDRAFTDDKGTPP